MEFLSLTSFQQEFRSISRERRIWAGLKDHLTEGALNQNQGNVEWCVLDINQVPNHIMSWHFIKFPCFAVLTQHCWAMSSHINKSQNYQQDDLLGCFGLVIGFKKLCKKYLGRKMQNKIVSEGSSPSWRRNHTNRQTGHRWFCLF